MQENTLLKRFKMGQVYYFITYYDTSFLIQKVMVTNFPQLNAPVAQLRFIDLNTNHPFVYNLYAKEIPIMQKRKDIILLGYNHALCIDKKAVFYLMREKLIYKYFSTRQYLFKQYRTQFQIKIIEIYKETLEYLKTI